VPSEKMKEEEKKNVMVNTEELTGTTEHLTLYMRCCINRCRYNLVRLCIESFIFILVSFCE
jgi:hypothetical protein